MSTASNAAWTTYAGSLDAAGSSLATGQNAAFVAYFAQAESAADTRDSATQGVEANLLSAGTTGDNAWRNSEILAAHQQAVAIASAQVTLGSSTAAAEKAYSVSEAAAARDRDNTQNAAQFTHDTATSSAEATRIDALWNAFLAYLPTQTSADATWNLTVKGAGASLKTALENAEAALIATMAGSQLNLTPLRVSINKLFGLATTNLLQSNAVQTANNQLSLDQGTDPSKFNITSPQVPPLVLQQMIAAANSCIVTDFWSAIESSLNYVAAGTSRDTLLSPQFGRTLDAVDGFAAGVADALTASASTRLRTLLYGESASRNHQGAAFMAGNIVGSLLAAPLGAANPCALSSWAGYGIRALNAIQFVGHGVSAYQHWQEGDYLSMAMDALGMLGNVAQMSRACFTGDMQVLTRRGWVRWDALQPGDEVASCDEREPFGQIQYRPLDAIFTNMLPIWHVHVKGRVIRTTAEHPFFVWGKGWVAAQHLEPGDRLRSDDGRMVAVEEVFDTGVEETVYNASIKEYHTYFVGAAEWGFSAWAHNACDPALSNLSNQGIRRLLQNIHHIATDKGTWARLFTHLFEGAGMSLQSALNRLRLTDHVGPHGLYNLIVYNRLTNAVDGFARGTAGYRRALRIEVALIRRDLRDANSLLGALVRARASNAEVSLARSLAQGLIRALGI